MACQKKATIEKRNETVGKALKFRRALLDAFSEMQPSTFAFWEKGAMKGASQGVGIVRLLALRDGLVVDKNHSE